MAKSGKDIILLHDTMKRPTQDTEDNRRHGCVLCVYVLCVLCVYVVCIVCVLCVYLNAICYTRIQAQKTYPYVLNFSWLGDVNSPPNTYMCPWCMTAWWELRGWGLWWVVVGKEATQGQHAARVLWLWLGMQCCGLVCDAVAAMLWPGMQCCGLVCNAVAWCAVLATANRPPPRRTPWWSTLCSRSPCQCGTCTGPRRHTSCRGRHQTTHPRTSRACVNPV